MRDERHIKALMWFTKQATDELNQGNALGHMTWPHTNILPCFSLSCSSNNTNAASKSITLFLIHDTFAAEQFSNFGWRLVEPERRQETIDHSRNDDFVKLLTRGRLVADEWDKGPWLVCENVPRQHRAAPRLWMRQTQQLLLTRGFLAAGPDVQTGSFRNVHELCLEFYILMAWFCVLTIH